MDWHTKFIGLAQHVATWSKDLNTKVGCVIVGEAHEVRSMGYNGLPRGVTDERSRMERPEKYFWTEHAERNAIYNAARMGTPTDNCLLFTTLFPCSDCARAIIQAGIKTIITPQPDWDETKWDFRKVAIMLKEAGVEVRFHTSS